MVTSQRNNPNSISWDTILRTSELLRQLADPCVLCPHTCRSRRNQGETGRCGQPLTAVIALAQPHFGEEPPISGSKGSGTVFFTGCNARCIFCQNYQISQEHMGYELTETQLATVFLDLQESGCTNINWVTPTPHLPAILHAHALAVQMGLTLPVVYNTNGYDDPAVIRHLEHIVHVYLPDLKYSQDLWAESLSGLPDYRRISMNAVTEMYRQVGPFPAENPAPRSSGLIVRHLILPNGLAGSRQVFEFIAGLDPDIPVSLMAQYQPRHLAGRHEMIHRPITRDEFEAALDAFYSTGLKYAYIQDLDACLNGRDPFFPDFSRTPDTVFS